MDRAEPGLQVDWVCSPAPGAPLQRARLMLTAGARAGDALHAAGHPALPEGWALALWGRKVDLLEPLQDGDRVELLRADPMETRRRRQAHQAAARRPRSTRHRP